MALYVIADLHLATANPEKTMNIFTGWENYTERLIENWNKTVKSKDDTVVVAGDISWAMGLSEAKSDFELLNSFNGRKIILKGNHDYWWNSLTKMNNFFVDNDFTTLNILHNNHYQYEKYGICGTRGWVNMPDEKADAKVLAREAMRLEASIQSALSANLEPIVFMHYPPIYGSSYNYDILDVLYKYDIKECYYGHIHGDGHKNALIGIRDGIKFTMVSGDYLEFSPKLVL